AVPVRGGAHAARADRVGGGRRGAGRGRVRRPVDGGGLRVHARHHPDVRAAGAAGLRHPAAAVARARARRGRCCRSARGVLPGLAATGRGPHPPGRFIDELLSGELISVVVRKLAQNVAMTTGYPALAVVMGVAVLASVAILMPRHLRLRRLAALDAEHPASYPVRIALVAGAWIGYAVNDT